MADFVEDDFVDKPCAAKGLLSYRYRGRFGWIMIGAVDDADAFIQAVRSSSSPVDAANLQKWNEATNQYLPITGQQEAKP